MADPRTIAQRAADCIHCGACTRTCSFLQRYGLDLSSLAERPELAYHCFLCGECRRSCPKGIDGSALSLAMRRERVARNGGRIPEKGFGGLLAEKDGYLFKNYRRCSEGTVLFPGCNFSGYYPRTTAHLSRLMEERFSVPTVFDCCGHPVDRLGLASHAEKNRTSLNERLRSRGVETVVVVCPNCFYHLRRTIDVPVISIYDFLQRHGFEERLSVPSDAGIFIPCPDRDTRELLGQVAAFVSGELREVTGVQCCGLGGCAAAKEPELAAQFANRVREACPEGVYAYCASCAGRFAAAGVPGVRHILSELLGIGEPPARSPFSLWHRAKHVL